jgi:hypothetical protein
VKYELLLRGRAKADIRRAAKWYERQREGLGRDFVAEVDGALALIEANPEQYLSLLPSISEPPRHIPKRGTIRSAVPE